MLVLATIDPPVAGQSADEAIDSQVHWGRRLAPDAVAPITAEDILSKAEVELLDLYFRAMSEGASGFACVPAAYPGGPIDPRFERMREALRARRLAARERLVARVGILAVEAGEGRMEAEQFAMAREVHASCVPRAAARARKRSLRLMAKLEKRLDRR